MNENGDWPKAEKCMPVRLALGRRMADMADLAQMDCGMVMELDAACTDDVEVYVGGRLHGRGQAVVVDGKLAVRMSEIVADTAIPAALQGPAPPGRANTR